MWTPDDYYKSYQYIPPAMGINYTAQLTIRSKTPGFMPIVFIQRNDFVNTSINYSSVSYPTMANYTQKYEKPNYQAINMVR